MEKIQLGAHLKQMRETRNMTKSAVAKQAGITDAYLGDIENNRRVPAEIVIEQFATVYGVTKSSLMARAGKLTSTAETWLKTTPEAIELVELMAEQCWDMTRIRACYGSTSETNL